MSKHTGNEYDVIVIGAGPAGCAAALRAQNGGSSVLVLEKRSRNQIFQSSRTSFEGLQNLTQKKDALDIFSDFGFNIDPECTYNGAVVHGPTGKKTSFYLNRPHGYFMRRQGPNSMDHQMIKIIEEEDIEIRFGCMVKKVSPEGDVLFSQDGQDQGIKANLIIGADGKHTVTGKDITNPLYIHDIAIGVGYHFKGPHGFEPGTAECWLGNDICPGEYAYALASEEEVTVVTTMRPHLLPPGSKPQNYLDRFISIPEVKQKIGISKKICNVVGSVPVLPGGPLGMGKILLVGEAARLTDPLLGFGMMNAIRSGYIAGRSCSKKDPLNHYSRSIKRDIIMDLKKKMRTRSRIVDELKDENITTLITIADTIIHQSDPNMIFNKEKRWTAIGKILKKLISQGQGRTATKYLLPLISSNFSF